MSAPPTISAALGLAIRRLRRARHLTIEDLAHSAGMHMTYLSSIERGARNPTWGKVEQLAEALGMSLPALAKAAEDEAVVTRIATAVRERLQTQAHNTPGPPPAKRSPP